MRMLEREFGSASMQPGRRKGMDFVDEEGKPIVGTVDAKGYIVTQGPRKRLAARVLQIIFSLAAAIPSIYAAVVRRDYCEPSDFIFMSASVGHQTKGNSAPRRKTGSLRSIRYINYHLPPTHLPVRHSSLSRRSQ
jgi:hypothetical protein